MNPRVIADFIKPALLAKGWKRVDVAWVIAPDPSLTDVPAAFVVPWKDKAQGGSRTGGPCGTSQVVDEQFGILIAAEIEDYEARRAEVRQALHGKQLPGRQFIVEFAEGEPREASRTILWWVDIYVTSLEWRSAP